MNARAVYALAALAGLAAALLILPLPALQGVGPGWDQALSDRAQAATGHLVFQADQWRWPPLFTTRLFWPHGVSVALTDGNPLVSLAAKLWVTVSGAPPANWLGGFLGLCFVLQAVSAAYAARGFGIGPAGAVAAALFAAIPLGRALARARWRRDALACALAVGVLRLLGGPLGGGDHGFTIYSMNLLSPVWPQRSGLFGPDLPIVEGVPGQYEGFNYLGGGVLLLLALAAFRVRAVPARFRGLIVMLAALGLFSLGSRVYAGSHLVLDLGAKPWEDIFGTFRTPGRAFWPVGDGLMLAAVAATGRWPRPAALALLALACVLQCIDARPLAAEDRLTWAEGVLPPPLPIPAGTALVSVSPSPGCATEVGERLPGAQMLLAAARAGTRLGDIGLGRGPGWFSCDETDADLAELPLLPGELRAFWGRAEQDRVVPARLGGTCSRVGTSTLCGDGLALPGVPLPPGPPLPVLSIPQRPKLAQLLGARWSYPEDGRAWSEGGYATLLFAVPPGRAVSVTLTLTGIAERAGGTRRVAIALGRQPASRDVELPDQQPTPITLEIPATGSGLVRLSLKAAGRAVDPAKRGLEAPVGRAALILDAAGLR